MTQRRRATENARLQWRIRLLLGCYPPWWRTRYDDEMRDTVVALRNEGRWNAAVGRDLLRGLVSAWVDPAAVPDAEGMPHPERRLVPFAAWGLLLFVLGGSGFAKMLEYPEFTGAADHHPMLRVSGYVLAGVAACTALVMTAAALVALAAVLRQPDRRWPALRPLLAVPLAMAALAVTSVLAGALADGRSPDHGRQVLAFGTLVAISVMCGAVCTVALIRTALQVPESRAVAVTRRVAMLSVGLLTTVGALAVVMWTLAMAFESPILLREHQGLVSTPTLATTVTCLGALLIGAASCLRAGVGVVSPRRRRGSC